MATVKKNLLSKPNVLPGFEDIVSKETEAWFFEGEKNERFFDSANLPDSPGRQVNGMIQTHSIYLLFPTKEDMIRATHALTQGARKGVAKKTRIVSINAVAEVPGEGITFLEMWEQFLLGIDPSNRDVDDEEAQAPI